jgi:hypothetical protein
MKYETRFTNSYPLWTNYSQQLIELPGQIVSGMGIIVLV